MNHRLVNLLATKSTITTGVTTIDLDFLDCISEIHIRHGTVNGAEANTTEHPMLNITKIEIVDGSDVLFSLDGPELQALDIYHSGYNLRQGPFHYLNGLDAIFEVGISFGRYLWDEELALDPSKFANPQLRITHNYALGGMTPASCFLRVNACLFDEKVISPGGFLMTKEIKRWDTTATDHQYTDLPTDYAYRKLFVQNRYIEVDPRVSISNIKLSSDGDKKVIVNHTASQILASIGVENSWMFETVVGSGAIAQRTYHVTPTANVQVMVTPWSEALGANNVASFSSGGGHLQVICEVANNIAMQVFGQCPHGAICIPFGKQGVIDDWFDVTRVGHLLLDITDGAATGITKIYIQQYRTY